MKFQVHDKASAPEACQEMLEQAEQGLGMIPNVLGVMADSPAALGGYLTINSLLEKSSLSPVEQQVVMLTVSARNECGYCVAAHTGLAKQAGVPEDVIASLRDGRAIGDEKLEALRSFTLATKEKQGWVSSGDLEAFAGAGYTRQHVLDVIAVLAMKTISNYTNHVAETPLDQPFEAMKWDGKS